jgi:hypothetical protein
MAAPFVVGSLKTSVTLPFPAVADVIVGAPGALAGVTALDFPDARLSVAATVASATTVKV